MPDIYSKPFVLQIAEFLHRDDFLIKLISVASEMESYLMTASALSRLGLDGEPDETGLTPCQKITAWVALQMGEIHQLELISESVFNLYIADVYCAGMERWPSLWFSFYDWGIQEGLSLTVPSPWVVPTEYYLDVLTSVGSDNWYSDDTYRK